MKPAFYALVLIILISGSALFLWVDTVSAQDQPAGTENTLLPEIDPQDIEIRSEFRARFPGLRRQPILGFNPTPRVYQIKSDRIPFMESREQIIANLPVSDLARPNPPSFSIPAYTSDVNGFGRFGLGSYTSPVAEFWGVQNLSDNAFLGGSFQYRSSDSHLESQPSSFRYMTADAALTTPLSEDLRLTVDADIQSDFNYLIEQTATPLVFEDEFPKKNYTGAGIGVELKHLKNSIEGWVANLDYSFFDVELESPILGEDTQESVFEGSFRKSWAGGNIQESFTVKINAEGGSITSSNIDQENWFLVEGGIQYDRLFNFSTQVIIDGNVSFVQDPFEGLNGESSFYLSPAVSVKHWFSDDLILQGSVSAKPYLTSVQKHHEKNRFLNEANILQHTYSIDASGKALLEYFRGSSIYAGISYMNAQNYPYYILSERSDVPLSGTLNSYSIAFMDATRIKGFAGLTHQLKPDKFWIHAEIYFQNQELDNGQDIPFEENWGLNSSVTVQIFNKIDITGRADYIGSRKTLTPAGELDSFLLVGGGLELDITDRIGAYAKLINILDDEYQVWQGYTERSFQIFGGITVTLD